MREKKEYATERSEKRKEPVPTLLEADRRLRLLAK